MGRRKRDESDDDEWFPSDDERKEQQKVEKKKKQVKAKAIAQAKKKRKVETQNNTIPLGPVTYKKCRMYDVSDEMEGEDVFEKLAKLQGKEMTIEWSVIELEFEGKKLLALKDTLRHGDVVNFFNYRLCGAFTVYREQETDEPLLIRNLGEFGYGVPLDFSDAPKDYFLDLENIVERYIDPEIMWEGSELYELMMEQIAERKKDPKYEGQTNADYGEQEIDLSKFPNGYYGYIESECESSTFGWLKKGDVEIDAEVRRAAKARYDKRRDKIRRAVMQIAAVFRSVMPQELITQVVQFVI